MKRLTTDDPQDNFSTILNFVYGKGGWAYIRSDGERENVPLTDYCRQLCAQYGCDNTVSLRKSPSPEEIDCLMMDCAIDDLGCPVALAYTFACQAVHMRDRCKCYEDVLFDGAGRLRAELPELDALLTKKETGRLVELPCAPGTKVYRIHYVWGQGSISIESFSLLSLSDFGTKVFLTKAEAAAALEKLILSGLSEGSENVSDPDTGGGA